MDYERELREAEEHKSRLEKAKEKLYTNDAPEVTRVYHEEPLVEEAPPPSAAWTPDAPRPVKKEVSPDKVNFWFRRALVGAVVFFFLSLGVAAAFFFYGSNIISSRNIAIDISAPASVPSSDSLSFDVSIQNGNNADLMETSLLIDYPEGTREVEDDTKPLVSEKLAVGTVAKGEIVKKTFDAKLFGTENTAKTIKVTYQYKIDGSTGTFSKEVSFDVVLRLAPIVVTVDALRETSNNKEIVLTTKIISNSNNTLKNVALNVDYPFGFTYIESNLEVESGIGGQFPIGDLLPNETKEVVIKGSLSGQSAEDKLFRFSVGTADADDLAEVKTILSSYEHKMVIQNDFFASTISSNPGYVKAGASYLGTVAWRNTLDTAVNDAEFSIKVSGELLGQQGVLAGDGFYDSSKSTIVWNKNTDESLLEVKPGESGDYSFSLPLATYQYAIDNRITNSKLSLSLDIKARRLNDRQVPEVITSSFTKIVPVVTSVLFNAKSLHSSGPIKNTGPIPPRAENKTTYTIALDISNSMNNISDAEVVATLPLYVTYEGEVNPQSQKVVWNQNSRQLRWDIGDIAARTGYGTAPRTLYFKVGISPSKTQIGSYPVLVKDILFKGYDDFAKTTVEVPDQDVTTATGDPGVVSEDGRVVQ